MKQLFLMLSFSLTTFLSAEDAQTEAFKKLNADSYSERTQAQVELSNWGRENPEKAIKTFHSYYLKEVSPEAKNRLLQLLKERVLFEKFGRPKGFVGIRMDDGLQKVGDAEVPVVIVTEVVAKSPADVHQLKSGDLIWRVDGEGFTGKMLPRREFSKRVTDKYAGDTVILDVLRNGELLKKTLVLGSMPEALELENNRISGAGTALRKSDYFEKWLQEHSK